MRQIEQINFEKSIAGKKLIYKRPWDEYFNTAFLFAYFGFFLFFFWFVISSSKTGNNDVVLEWVVLIIISLVCIYVLFRRIREPYLLELKTSFDKKGNKEMILRFYGKQELVPSEEPTWCFRVHEDNSSFGRSYGKSTIILIEDYAIYFTILKSGRKLDIPTLSSDFQLKKELKHFFETYE